MGGEALPLIPDSEEEAASMSMGGAVVTSGLLMPQLIDSTGEW